MAPNFSKFNLLDYSSKNIPTPSQKEYRFQLIHSVEKFVRNLKWRIHFYLNPRAGQNKETFGFRSIRKGPNVKGLEYLEQRLKSLIANIEFRPFSNNFQNKLKEDIRAVNDQDKLLYQCRQNIKYLFS